MSIIRSSANEDNMSTREQHDSDNETNAWANDLYYVICNHGFSLIRISIVISKHVDNDELPTFRIWKKTFRSWFIY